MAELFIPKIIDLLGDEIFNRVGERVNMVMGVQEEVTKLSFQLGIIQKVLHNAESRRLKEKEVGLWLERLEDIAYEMEDVLDEWIIRIYKPKNPNDGNDQNRRETQTLFQKVRSCFSSLCSCLMQVPIRSDIAFKIEDINDKLESTLKEANQFNFLTTSSSRHAYSNDFKPPLTTSIFNESEVYSRELDKQSLLLYLVPKDDISNRKVGKGRAKGITRFVEDGNDGFKVVSIVGLGGSGKTTLAQALFNDHKVKQEFELRKWICVSIPFDEVRIAKALIENLGKSYPDVAELENMFQFIKESYSQKKFLLVLDDVWNEDSSKWQPFRDTLKDCAAGSIIMVTTRSDRVARAIGTDYKHSLGLLKDSDCWLILKRVALVGRSEFSQRVETIGRDIAKKCKGLPLAAKAMGSLLQFKETVHDWQEVSESEIWQMEEAAVELFPHFYLSYNELSPQMKHCFSYCAVIPKGTSINIQLLVRLWMAQGYLGKTGGDERLEMKGLAYFNNLAMRSFFQELTHEDDNTSRIVHCKMHDIVHDFAQFLMKHEYRKIDCSKPDKTTAASSFRKGTHHVTLLGTTGTMSSSSIVPEIEKVRSLFISNDEVPLDLFSSLKCIRALTLSHERWSTSERQKPVVLREIGNLIHLRFLNLSGNSFKELPETICDLYYLETLDIRWCHALSCLPPRLADLVHLRHLLSDGTEKLIKMPPGFEKMASIRTLDVFRVGGRYNDISILRYLDQLEEICIIVHGKVDFRNAELRKKLFLQNLELNFEDKGCDYENVSSIMELNDPPPKLETLKLVNYPGPEFPEWIVSQPLIHSLRRLTLYSAPNVLSLPALEKLSSLEFLWIHYIPEQHSGFFKQTREKMKINRKEKFHGIDHVAPPFPSLKRVRIMYHSHREALEDLGGADYENDSDDLSMMPTVLQLMPRLQELTITRSTTPMKVVPVSLRGPFQMAPPRGEVTFTKVLRPAAQIVPLSGQYTSISAFKLLLDKKNDYTAPFLTDWLNWHDYALIVTEYSTTIKA